MDRHFKSFLSYVLFAGLLAPVNSLGNINVMAANTGNATVKIVSPTSTALYTPAKIIVAVTGSNVKYVKIMIQKEGEPKYLDINSNCFVAHEVYNDAQFDEAHGVWQMPTGGVEFEQGARYIITAYANDGADGAKTSGTFKMSDADKLPTDSWEYIWDTVVPNIEAKIVPPTFPDRDFLLTDYGDSSNWKAAFDAAINACSKAGGGRVVVPKGNYTVNGPIVMKSNVNLYVEGANIKFGFDTEFYKPYVWVRASNARCYNYSPLIYSYQQTNIAITGNGTFDGQVSAWSDIKNKKEKAEQLILQMGREVWPEEDRILGDEYPMPPDLLQFYGCKNILLDGITVKGSPFWTIHPAYCENITLRNAKIQAGTSNDDGFDPDSCKNVLVENCVFSTNDDNISIKSGGTEEAWEDMPCENIIIRNNTFTTGHSNAICIGSQTAGSVFGVYAYNNTINNVVKSESCLYIKSDPTRGGEVSQIYFKDINITDAGSRVIWIQHTYKGKTSGGHPTNFHAFFFDNINVERAQNGIIFENLKETDIYDVYFNNVIINNLYDPGQEGRNDVPKLVPVSRPGTQNIRANNCMINGINYPFDGEIPASMLHVEPRVEMRYYNNFSNERLGALPESNAQGTWELIPPTSPPALGSALVTQVGGERVLEVAADTKSSTAKAQTIAKLTFAKPITDKIVVIKTKIRKGANSDGVFMNIPNFYSSDGINGGGIIIANDSSNGGANQLSLYYNVDGDIGWKSPLGADEKIMSLDEAWRDVTLILDFSEKTIAAMLDGMLIAKNIPFRKDKNGKFPSDLAYLQYIVEIAPNSPNRISALYIKEINVTSGNVVRLNPIPLRFTKEANETSILPHDTVTVTFNQGTDNGALNYSWSPVRLYDPSLNVELYNTNDRLIPNTDYAITYDRRTYTYSVKSKLPGGFVPDSYILKFNNIRNAYNDSTFCGEYPFKVIQLGFFADEACTIEVKSLAQVEGGSIYACVNIDQPVVLILALYDEQGILRKISTSLNAQKCHMQLGDIKGYTLHAYIFNNLQDILPLSNKKFVIGYYT